MDNNYQPIMFMDLETTGCIYNKHSVIQMAYIITDGKNELLRNNIKLSVQPNTKISKSALEIQNVTIQQIAKYPNYLLGFEQMKRDIESIIDPFDTKDKLLLSGYNFNFDNDFLRELFRRCGCKYYGSYFYSNAIDIMDIAGLALMKERKDMENFKLMTVAKQFGITIDESKLHDAMYDIEITKNIFDIIM